MVHYMKSYAPTELVYQIFHRLRHRGPDWSGIHSFEDCYLAHQRLAIVDPTSGDQPLYNEDKTVVVTVSICSENAVLLFSFILFVLL
jgi:asparagine synthase (glutamine-hydrolysing)